MDINLYELVTKRIIDKLEKGIIPWKRPWKISGVKITNSQNLKKFAFNRITKTAYSPLNQWLLSKTGEYASFKQWQEVGGHIKKGAKAEMVVFWKILKYKDEKKSTETEIIYKQIPILKHLYVFHIDDVEGVEPLELKEEQQETMFQPIEKAEQIISDYLKRESIKISFEGNSAFYAPAKDSITIPEAFKFKNNKAEYYSTIFHEITHSTGHKKRLNRLSENAYFGNQEYSKEELVAELGASGILNLLDIENDSSFTNSTAYIQSWIERLRNDNKLIIQASAKAEQAIKFIINGSLENI